MRTIALTKGGDVLELSTATETRAPGELSRMMGDMISTARCGITRLLQLVLFLLMVGLNYVAVRAQTEYSVHFEMEKPAYLLGEPIFCRFVIRNTGAKVFAFRYRTPTRGLGTDYNQEPRFQV